MELLELAKKRYSVRNYLPKIVEQEKLDIILEAGRVAPTACNMQPQKLIIIKNREALEKLRKGANIYNAPMAIIVCTDKNEVWVRPQDGKKTIDIDASIVTDHMMLQATELGLGTLWMTWFDPKILRDEFLIPENYEIVNILLIGYPDCEIKSPERHTKTRKPAENTIFYDKY